MPKRILLYATTNWPSSARYAGGFYFAGSEVHAACPKDAFVRLSRYIARAHIYRPLAPISSLRRTIADSAPDLVVPCDDRAVAHLVRLGKVEEKKPGSAIAKLIARSIGDTVSYARVLSRNLSLDDLKAHGVRVPETLPVKSESDLDACLDVTGLPAALKADGSWGGDGVVIARTREEAHSAFRRLSRPPSRLRSLLRAIRRRDTHFVLSALWPSASAVCVQRFVAGRSAASAFAAHEGKIVAAFHYDVLVAAGETGPPNVVRRVDDAQMDEAVRTAAACFGLSGLHGLDYIRDENGAAYVIEINPRATQGGTLPFGVGRDLPSALMETLGAPAVWRRPAIANDVVAFFPREMRLEPSSRYLTEAHHDVPSDDPAVMRALLDAAGGRNASPERAPGTSPDRPAFALGAAKGTP